MKLHNRLKTWIKILFGLIIIIVDLFVYIVIGLLLMNYDDFYDENKGEYWSFESMTTSEKLTVVGLNVWHVLNLLAIGYLLYWLIKKWNKKATIKTN